MFSGKTLGFLGPLIATGDLEKYVEFFPTYHATKTLANKTVASEENVEDSTKKPKKSSKKTSENGSSNPKIKREAFQLDYITESFRPFRSCPTLDKSYLDWITKVGNKKLKLGKNWKFLT